MKNYLYYLFILFLFSTIDLDAQSDINENDDFRDCLISSESKYLMAILLNFENKILNSYSKDKNEAYIKYLVDVRDLSFSHDLVKQFRNDKILRDFTKSEFYKKNWVTLKSDDELMIAIPPVNGESQSSPHKILTLNPNSNYFVCLSKNNKSETLQSYFKFIASGLDLSPALIAGPLIKELKMIKSIPTRTRYLIAVDFYYSLFSGIND